MWDIWNYNRQEMVSSWDFIINLRVAQQGFILLEDRSDFTGESFIVLESSMIDHKRNETAGEGLTGG